MERLDQFCGRALRISGRNDFSRLPLPSGLRQELFQPSQPAVQLPPGLLDPLPIGTSRFQFFPLQLDDLPCLGQTTLSFSQHSLKLSPRDMDLGQFFASVRQLDSKVSRHPLAVADR